MSTIVYLLDKAIDLTASVLSSMVNSDLPLGPSVPSNNEELIAAIDSVAVQIDRVAGGIVDKVQYALERIQLEKLSAQAKGVKLAMEFGNEGMLGQAIMSISEQADYSTARIAEGKYEWLGPWMAAEAIRIEGLRMLAKSERASAVVRAEVLKFRLNILNLVGKLLVESQPAPWQQIVDFVEGRNNDVLNTVREIKSLHSSHEKPMTTARIDNTGTKRVTKASVKTVLAPANSWPFPTSGKS